MPFSYATLSYLLIVLRYIGVHTTTPNMDNITGLIFNDDVVYDPGYVGTEYVSGYGYPGPIGFYTSNFTTMITHSYMFIDKSLFIKAILEYPGDSHILITCPRRWGKSINLLMLKLFLEPQVHPNGTLILPRTETTNYKLFMQGRIDRRNWLRHPLRISKYKNIVDQFQGQWPVIYLQLFFSEIENYQNFEDQLKRMVFETYEMHKYMLQVLADKVNGTNNALNDEEKSQAQKDYDTFATYLTGQPSRNDLKNSLVFLSKLLSRHFGKKVFVLVDSYDDLLSYSYSEGTSDSGEQMVRFYMELLTDSMRQRDHIRRFVLTGICNTQLFHNYKVTDVVEHTLFNSTFTPFFGYSEREASLIFDHMNISQPQRQLIRIWSNGYRYGTNPSVKIYHPLSINIYLACRSFDYFYEPKLPLITKTIALFYNVPRFENIWCAMLTGLRYTLHTRTPDFTYENLASVEKAIAKHRQPFHFREPWTSSDEEAVDTALLFYLLNGYLTWGRRLPPSNSSDATRISVKIANKETIRRLKTFVNIYYAENCFNITSANMSMRVESINELFTNFVESTQNRALSFEVAYDMFLADIPNLDTLDKVSATCHCANVREYVRSSLLGAFTCRNSFEMHGLQFPDHTDAPDILMTRQNIGVMIFIHYDKEGFDSTDVPVNTTYAVVFNQSDYFSHIDRVKFVAIRLHANKTIMTRGWTEMIR